MANSYLPGGTHRSRERDQALSSSSSSAAVMTISRRVQGSASGKGLDSCGGAPSSSSLSSAGSSAGASLSATSAGLACSNGAKNTTPAAMPPIATSNVANVQSLHFLDPHRSLHDLRFPSPAPPTRSSSSSIPSLPLPLSPQAGSSAHPLRSSASLGVAGKKLRTAAATCRAGGLAHAIAAPTRVALRGGGAYRSDESSSPPPSRPSSYAGHHPGLSSRLGRLVVHILLPPPGSRARGRRSGRRGGRGAEAEVFRGDGLGRDRRARLSVGGEGSRGGEGGQYGLLGVRVQLALADAVAVVRLRSSLPRSAAVAGRPADVEGDVGPPAATPVVRIEVHVVAFLLLLFVVLEAAHLGLLEDVPVVQPFVFGGFDDLLGAVGEGHGLEGLPDDHRDGRVGGVRGPLRLLRPMRSLGVMRAPGPAGPSAGVGGSVAGRAGAAAARGGGRGDDVATVHPSVRVVAIVRRRGGRVVPVQLREEADVRHLVVPFPRCLPSIRAAPWTQASFAARSLRCKSMRH
ncbi:hypothetical protein ACHAWF_012618 [Thalassiosira exigua]